LEELSPYEARAKAFVAKIIGTLDRTIASGKLTDEGVVSASTEIFRFTSYFAPLIRNLRFLDPQRAELSANYLWQLMGAARRVGQLQGRVDQAMVATDGKRKKADAGKEAIWAAIVKAAEDLGCPKLSISKEFANRLRPGVLKQLGLPSDWKGQPSTGQIKSTISARRNRSVPKE
jgi:hypothetical protein